MYISQNNSYKQHHTTYYLHKPATCSKSLVHLSKVSIYFNEHISAIRMKSHCSQKNIVKILGHVVNITMHSVKVFLNCFGSILELIIFFSKQ